MPLGNRRSWRSVTQTTVHSTQQIFSWCMTLGSRKSWHHISSRASLWYCILRILSPSAARCLLNVVSRPLMCTVTTVGLSSSLLGLYSVCSFLLSHLFDILCPPAGYCGVPAVIFRMFFSTCSFLLSLTMQTSLSTCRLLWC